MKKRACLALTGRTALLYFACVTACQTVEAQREARFRLLHDTVVVISIEVNDQGPFEFILDTGTDTTILDAEFASRLSLVPIDVMTLTTVSGKQTLVRSSVRKMALGAAAVPDLEVLLQDMAELRRLDAHICGIVGQNFLSHFNYALDYGRRSLRIELGSELRESLSAERVQIEISEGKMLVPAELHSFGRTKMRLLLDSGANSLILFRKMAQVRPAGLSATLLGADSHDNARGIRMGQVDALTVGSRQFRDLTVAFAPAASVNTLRLEDGLLPTVLFRVLYINNRERFVMFNPQF
jgi:hypothetical protein